MRPRRRLLIVPVLLLALACTHAPPTLSPQGQAAFAGIEVIHALDLFRNVAIDANAQVPPLIPTATTRKIVNYHKAAISIVHAAPQGWARTVLVSLDELTASLTPVEQQQVLPYATLIKTILQEAMKP